MSAAVEIRSALASDLPALVEIYNHYVVNTPATFDTRPFDVATRRAWFDGFAATGPHRLLVADVDNVCVGYASSQPFRPKPAYHTTVETTVYLAPAFLGQGIGRKLYGRLLDIVESEPLHLVLGGITQPNEASRALHESLGFTPVGTYHEVGFKFDRYWDVTWYEKRLGGRP